MAYRDEIDRVMKENDEIRKALAKARADARFTALRQTLVAFALGLSWSILGDDASAGERYDRCIPPPVGMGWLEVRPDEGSTFVIDKGWAKGSQEVRFAIPAGKHQVRFFGPYGEHCTTVTVSDGRTSWAYDGERQGCW
jgi:hypothetical protein